MTNPPKTLPADFQNWDSPKTLPANFDFGSQPTTPTTAPTTDTSSQEKFGGPAWLGSKQMSAQEFTKQSALQQYSQAFMTTLPKSLAEFFVKAPTELAISAGEVPTDIYAAATGQPKIQTQYNVPLLGKMTSIQSQAQSAMDKGAQPFTWKSFYLPSLQAVADGLATKASLDTTVKGLQGIFGDWNISSTGIDKIKTGAIEKIVNYFQDKGTAKDFNYVLDSTMPKMTTGDKAQAISQAGKPGGAVPGKGFSSSGVDPTPKDLERASDIMPFADKDPIKMATNINTEAIPGEAQKVEGYLKSNPAEVDTNSLVNQVKSVKSSAYLKPDNVAAVDRLKNDAVDIITSSKSDNLSQWQARIKFDQDVKSQLGGIFDQETKNAVNTSLYQIRQLWNNSVQVATTKAGATSPEFLDGMGRLSNYYTALENIGQNYGKTLGGDTTLMQYAKGIGKLALKGVKWGAAAIGLGALGKEGYDLIK